MGWIERLKDDQKRQKELQNAKNIEEKRLIDALALQEKDRLERSKNEVKEKRLLAEKYLEQSSFKKMIHELVSLVDHGELIGGIYGHDEVAYIGLSWSKGCVGSQDHGSAPRDRWSEWWIEQDSIGVECTYLGDIYVRGKKEVLLPLSKWMNNALLQEEILEKTFKNPRKEISHYDSRYNHDSASAPNSF